MPGNRNTVKTLMSSFITNSLKNLTEINFLKDTNR